MRAVLSALGLTLSSVKVENNGNFSVSDLRFLDITAFYNTSSDASTYKLKVNSKTTAEDSIDAPWATVAIMGTVGSVRRRSCLMATHFSPQAPLLFLHYVDDISGALLTYNGTVRAIHLLPGAPAVTVTVRRSSGSLQGAQVPLPRPSQTTALSSSIAISSTWHPRMRLTRSFAEHRNSHLLSAYAPIPQGQTLFTFTANGQTLFTEYDVHDGPIALTCL